MVFPKNPPQFKALIIIFISSLFAFMALAPDVALSENTTSEWGSSRNKKCEVTWGTSNDQGVVCEVKRKNKKKKNALNNDTTSSWDSNSNKNCEVTWGTSNAHGVTCETKKKKVTRKVLPPCPAGKHRDGAVCVAEGFKACKKSKHICPSDQVCDKGLDGLMACFTKENHKAHMAQRQAHEKQLRQQARMKKIEDEEEKFRRAHGLDYKEWLEQQKQAALQKELEGAAKIIQNKDVQQQ